MKKIIVALLSACLLLYACNDQITDIKTTYTLDVSPKTYTFPAEGGELQFDVVAKRIQTTYIDGMSTEMVTEEVPYELTITGEGFTLKNNENVVFATQNESPKIRVGTLTVKIRESTLTAQITLTQEKNQVAESFPLPGGKKNFSVVMGHFEKPNNALPVPIKIWAQLSNIGFNSENRTFREEAWYWDTVMRKGKTFFSSYYGTIDGQSGMIYLYTPTGWIYPEGQSTHYEGTYRYDETTKQLELSYPDGKVTKWDIDNPEGYGGFARMVFNGSNRDITHAIGYGSNADWNVFTKLGDIPRTTYSGRSVLARGLPDDYRNWFSTKLIWNNFEWNENGSALRYHQRTASFETEKGIIYHFAGNNDSRAMIQNHFVGDLAGDAFPTYTRNLHPYAVQQLMNDEGDLVGFLMIEEQNPPEAFYDGNFQYQIRYALMDSYVPSPE